MIDAIPAGAAFIDIKPSLRTFGKELAKGATPAGKAAGLTTGKALGGSALKAAEPSLRKLGAAVGSARSKEADAAGKVRVAEARLNEVRNDSRAKASALARAEETLAKAQREHTTAQARATDATKDYTRAQDRAADKVAETDRRTAGLVRRLNGAKGAFAGARSKASGFAKSTGGQVLGGVAAYATIDSAVGFGKSSIAAASEKEQSAGGVKAIFGKNAKEIETAARGAAKNFGLTENAYNQLASTLGAGLKNKGIKDYAAQTKTLISYSADLSAQFGGTTQEASEALASAMRGEMDPIEKYGVTLNQDAIAAEAFALGLAKPVKNLDLIKSAQNKAIVAQRDYNEAVKEHGKGSDQALTAEARLLGAQTRLGKALEGNKPKLTDQQKAQASLSLITKQTSTAQGTFTRELNTAAGQNAVLAASWGDVKAKLGEQLLPAVTSGTSKLTDFVVGMNEGTGAGGDFVDTMQDITGALKTGWDTIAPYKREIALAAGAFGAWKVVSGVVGGVTSEVNKARAAVSSVRNGLGTLKKGASDFRAGLNAGAAEGSGGKVQTLGEAFRKTGTRAKEAGRSAVSAAKTGGSAVLRWGKNAATAAGNFGKLAAAQLRTKATAAGSWLKSAGSAVLASGKAALTAAGNYAKLAAAHVRTGIAAAGSAVKTTALKVAQLASAAATKTLTVVTRVFNAVLRMNPLGLVVTALTALGVGLVIAYKKSATFRRIVDGAFAGVRRGAAKVVGWFRETALPWMSRVFTVIGAKASELWTRNVRPAFSKIGGIARSVFGWIGSTGLPWVRSAMSKIGGVVRWLWSKVYQPYLGFIFNASKRVFGWVKNTGLPWMTSAFRGIGSAGRSLWTKWLSPAFKNMRSGANRLVDVFRAVKSGIGKVWNGLKDTIASPIKTALRWVNDYFIKPINSMLSKVGASFKVPTLNIGGDAVSGKGRYDAGGFYTGGRTGGRARGGILPGYTPMHRGDDQLTPMRSGEGVLVSEGLRDGRSRSAFLAANEAAKRGVSFAKFLGGGYAAGGIVALGKRLQGMGYHVSEHPAFGGVAPGAHSANGWHYKAGALDVNADPWLTKFRSEMPALDTLNAMLRREGWNTIWRAANHFDHLHVDVANGQSGGLPSGGGGGFLTGLAKRVFEKGRGVLNALLDKAPKGLWSQVLVGTGRRLTQAVYDRFMSAVSAADSGETGPMGNVPTGSNVDLARRMAAARGWTGGEWTALRNLWQRESGFNHRAKNPTSGAYGIPQALPASKMAASGSDWATNPRTQIDWGLDYIAGRPDYGRPSKAWAAWQSRSPHWYARGTTSAQPGPAILGEEGPEAVWFDGGERVDSARQTRRLFASAAVGPQRFVGDLRLKDGRAYIEGIVEDVLEDTNNGADALERTR